MSSSERLCRVSTMKDLLKHPVDRTIGWAITQAARGEQDVGSALGAGTDQWCCPTRPPAGLRCWGNLSRDRIADARSGFSRLNTIGVPVQDRQMEAIAQKRVVLRGEVLLDSLQVSREGFQHRTSLR